MRRSKAVIVDCNMITPYGIGINPCWEGLSSGETAIKNVNRFNTGSFISQKAAIVKEIKTNNEYSLVMQMLRSIFEEGETNIPKDASLMLATTTGEIDLLEEYVLGERSDSESSRLDLFLAKVRDLYSLEDSGVVVSAACASASVALANASSMIHQGIKDSVLVVACDSVSEFVFAGFSSLMALDKDVSRPFDKSRHGLSLGEAAGYILVMSEERALKENREILGEVSGWGLTSDANHMTGPSRDGSGLAKAINKALEKANIRTSEVGCISAHGTGTVYNDSMEMKAFKTVFTEPCPVYSIKGGTGHTMGAAGLLEAIIALKSLEEKVVPPTVNMVSVDDEALGWAFSEKRKFDFNSTISVNAGFGGINSAIVLRTYND